VDRGIRRSEMVDMSKLVITPGEKVLKMFVDFNILNDDGNLIDAASLAVTAALLTTKYPDPKAIAENPDVDIKEVERIPLPIQDVPVTVTTAVVDGKYLVDPCLPEESAAEALLSITHTRKDEICSMQLLSGELDYNQLFDILNISLDKSREIRELLLSATGVKI
jgi:exosome complex component RRP42